MTTYDQWKSTDVEADEANRRETEEDPDVPYIRQSRRRELNAALQPLLQKVPQLLAGELNYCLTMIVSEVWKSFPSYAAGERVAGLLKRVDDEFYRRVIAPYEDERRREHGDVFETVDVRGLPETHIEATR